MIKTYKELYSTHCEYKPELNEKLKLLYEGGYAIKERADLFLDRLSQLESPQAYNSRLKSISYIPYLSEFITQFSASLFSEPLEVKQQSDAPDATTAGEPMEDDFYKQFLESCDLERRSYHQFAQDILEKALDEICVYVSLDFPKGERTTRAQEKAQGLDRGYACVVPYCNVIDWKIDTSTGKFIWVKEFEEIFPDDDPIIEQKHYFQFRIRTMKKKDGKSFGGWDIWRSEHMKKDKKCDAKTKFTLITDEEVITSFPEINLWKLQVNKAYHVGQQIGSICQEHYQRRSFMVANANKTCVGLGVVKLGPDYGAPGDMLPPDFDVPDTSNDVRKKLENDGWIVLRKTDKWEDDIEIVEAKGESHKFIAEELRHLVESMMQTLRQMNMTATANQKAVGRSAASKQMDQHGTSMLLSVYERVIKDFSKLLFECLAAGRQEDIHFAVEGLSIAEPSLDRQQIVEEISKLGIDILNFPNMWKQKYLNRMASELIDNNLTDKERLELEEKFEESIDAGKFEVIDADEAVAAGNKMGKVTKSHEGSSDPSDPSSGTLPSNASQVDPKTMHDRSVSTAGVASSVMKQLKPDYSKDLLQWIPAAHWIQMDIPLDSIDDSNRESWQATRDQSKIDSMADAMKEGWRKPIIAVNEPNASKLQLTDGHHRFLAAEQNGEKTIPAYVAYVGGIDGPWKDMHDLQKQGQNGGKSNQSQQSNQKDS